MRKILDHNAQLPLCFDAPASDIPGISEKGASEGSNVVSIHRGRFVRDPGQEQDVRANDSVILDTVLTKAKNLGW